MRKSHKKRKTNLVLSEAEHKHFSNNYEFDIESHNKTLQSTYKNIQSLDVGKLLNEDAERSRNILLTATFATVVFTLLDVEGASFFGLKFSVEGYSHIIIILLLVCLTVVFSIYYFINSEVEQISKKTTNTLLYEEIHFFEKYLSFLISERRQLLENEYITKKEKALSKLQISQTEKRIEELRDFEKGISKHSRNLRKMPYYVITGCLAFEFISIGIKFTNWEFIKTLLN